MTISQPTAKWGTFAVRLSRSGFHTFNYIYIADRLYNPHIRMFNTAYLTISWTIIVLVITIYLYLLHFSSSQLSRRSFNWAKNYFPWKIWKNNIYCETQAHCVKHSLIWWRRNFYGGSFLCTEKKILGKSMRCI